MLIMQILMRWRSEAICKHDSGKTLSLDPITFTSSFPSIQQILEVMFQYLSINMHDLIVNIFRAFTAAIILVRLPYLALTLF